MATQEDAILTYRTSDMILMIHSNKAHSQAGGHIFMAGGANITFNNGAIVDISQMIWAVMYSTAEVELGAIFINAKTAISMQQTLIKLGHPQPRTPMQTDNATAYTPLINKILHQSTHRHGHALPLAPVLRHSRPFHYYWRPGTQNLADYFTNHHHHPTSHHKSVCATV